MDGTFSVKRTPGEFNSVRTDMCLEQTINRSSKGKGGVVGETKRKDFFTLWNLIYHERLTVNNLWRNLSDADFDKREQLVHHKFSASEIAREEQIISNVVKFIISHENPVSFCSESRLHHLITQEILGEDISQDLLNIFLTGEDLFKEFRKKRFLERSEKVSDTIHRNNFKTFDSSHADQKKPTSLKTAKNTKMDIVRAQKMIDLARVRQFDVNELFKYNLVLSSFEADRLMTTTQKSLLVKELEKYGFYFLIFISDDPCVYS